MADYRRWYVPGGTYFFTVVTYDRTPIFRDPAALQCLGRVMRDVRARLPFQSMAIVVLWDHLHSVWSLPPGDCNFSRPWQQIKGGFTERWLEGGNAELAHSPSQRRRGEHRIWQRRFWEHVIRDESDLEQHVDYIHYNPVKHGYVTDPGAWAPSSFGQFVRAGHYPPGWGTSEPTAPFPLPRE